MILCLDFEFNSLPATLAQGAAASSYQVYLPLVFRPPATQMLAVSKIGTGSGMVTSNPPGIDCGSTCSHEFTKNSTVTLSAAANTGSTFTGWSGSGCSGMGTCTVTMDDARSVTATFTLYYYALEVIKYGTGMVTSNPGGIDCGFICSYAFAYNTEVTLMAIPESPSTFGGWSGACTGTETCKVTMSEFRSVTATFTTTGGGIVNGGFESGSTGWTEYSDSGSKIIRHQDDLYNVSPHSGVYAAWLGLYYGETSYIKQEVTISSSTHHLVYWQWIVSDDSCGHDGIAEIFIDGTQVNYYDLCTDTSTEGWVSHSVDLEAYSGQSVWLRIGVRADGYNYGDLYIDDVSLQASAP
jgi:hypothetical protein